MRCAWPADRKGSHRVRDCIRPIKLDKGTASFPKAKDYQKMKVAAVNLPSDSSGDSESSEDSSSTDSTESSDDSQSEFTDGTSKELDQEPQEEGNWWDSPEGSD